MPGLPPIDCLSALAQFGLCFCRGSYGTRCRSDTSSYVEGCGVTAVPIETNKDNSSDPDTKVAKTQITVPSVKDSKQRNTMITQLVQMSKTSMAIPERIFGGLKKRRSTIRSKPTKSQVIRSLRRSRRGLLGQDSINPFEDARVFVFNPLCCFNWKAAEVEWSNAKNWYTKRDIDRSKMQIYYFFCRARDIRTSVG